MPMNRLTEEQLMAWEALANAASPGPWTSDRDEFINDADDEEVVQLWECMMESVFYNHHENAAFIAASREAVSVLAAEVRRLQRYEAYVLRLQRNCERAIAPENHAPHYMMEATIKAEAQTMLEDIRALLAEEA